MKISIIGIDLAKRAFQKHGCDADSGVAVRKKLLREKVLAFPAGSRPASWQRRLAEA